MNALILILIVYALCRLAKATRSRPRRVCANQRRAIKPAPAVELRPVYPSPAEITRQQIERERLRMAEERRRQIEQERRRIAAEREQRKLAADRQARMQAEETHRQAQADLEHLDIIRAQYMALYDELEQERNAADTTPRRRQQLIRQMITLEERLYGVDRKRNAAYAKLEMGV